MNEHIHRIRFWYDSKPKSVRYVGIGFGLMILTVIMVHFFNVMIVAIFAATMGLCGLVLFVMGLMYGVIDLYNSFGHKDKLSDNKL